MGACDVPPRVSFGRASRDRAMLAFESPVAAACARHNDERTFFQKARSKRKKPATAAAVADFGTRRLPGDVGHEDGSPPAHDDAPGADAPPTVSAAPPPKRRRSEPARTATHVVPAPAATTGLSLDHALSATLVVVLHKLAGMQAPPPPPPPTDALSAEDRKTVELIVMGMNAASSDACKEKLGGTLQHVIDMRIARVNASASC
jgi:hypothetical protein